MSYRDRSNDTGRSDRKGYLYIFRKDLGFSLYFVRSMPEKVVLIKLMATPNVNE